MHHDGGLNERHAIRAGRLRHEREARALVDVNAHAALALRRQRRHIPGQLHRRAALRIARVAAALLRVLLAGGLPAARRAQHDDQRAQLVQRVHAVRVQNHVAVRKGPRHPLVVVVDRARYTRGAQHRRRTQVAVPGGREIRLAAQRHQVLRPRGNRRAEAERVHLGATRMAVPDLQRAVAHMLSPGERRPKPAEGYATDGDWSSGGRQNRAACRSS